MICWMDLNFIYILFWSFIFLSWFSPWVNLFSLFVVYISDLGFFSAFSFSFLCLFFPFPHPCRFALLHWAASTHLWLALLVSLSLPPLSQCLDFSNCVSTCCFKPLFFYTFLVSSRSLGGSSVSWFHLQFLFEKYSFNSCRRPRLIHSLDWCMDELVNEWTDGWRDGKICAAKVCDSWSIKCCWRGFEIVCAMHILVILNTEVSVTPSVKHQLGHWSNTCN